MAQARLCASGSALAFAEHWVSIMETLFHASAAANAGSAMANASNNEILFNMMVSPL
jgi:K+-transporting ATPase A subunit